MGSKISVIVPIFNVERYLSKCIESIINQSYNNLEIILVNDGSTDSSFEICKYYSTVDHRIKIVNKRNGGLSSARNAGLDLASGDYISFVDSDDYLDLDMYNVMLKFALDNKLNIASCGVNYVYSSNHSTTSGSGKEIIYDIQNAIISLFSSKFSIRFEVWNKLFKSDLLKEIRFKKNQVYEDIYFDRSVLLKEKLIGYIDFPFYNYLCSREGNTNSWFNRNRLCFFPEIKEFISDLERMGYIKCSNQFKNFFLDTSISLFIDSRRLNAGKKVERYIILSFRNHFFRFIDFSNFRAIKYSVFYLSPGLLHFGYSIKNLFFRK